jgi:hypothetical protein
VLQTPARKIDHIVFAVEHLETAVTEIEKKIGVKALVGGHHKNFGTKNALIKLNDRMYLEILAADDTNPDVLPPRWMGIDALTKNRITRWAITSTNLERDSALLNRFNASMAQVSEGSRQLFDGSLLRWKLILPLALPEVELIPFSIDWGGSDNHPTDNLPNMGCQLLELYGTHPQPTIFNNIFEQLGVNLRIEEDEHIQLKAVLKGPEGIVQL